jgi:dTDP-4-amino-4,6-dideoxygalactose transaminase
MSTANASTAERPDVAGPIQFIDLGAQRRLLGERIDVAVKRVLDHGKYILGPEVRELEAKLAEWAGVKHAIGVSNGTDALALALMAWRIWPGDAVFVPDFTFAATAEVVAWLGATPVFCDVLEETFNLDPDSLEAAISKAKDDGLTPRAVIAVDLFGQPADYRRIEPIARKHGLKLLADAAQSFGASLDRRPAGGIGDIAATSFFPAKPLGCYGDGGAVFTNDDEAAQQMRSLRVHGQGSDKYDNVAIGMNGRLDTMQAAILLEKLSIFPEELETRQTVADRYAEALGKVVTVPSLMAGSTSAWAQYTIRTSNRDALAARLKDRGIPTAIYYPKPLSTQTAYRSYPTAPGGTPVSAKLAEEVISLPMHPYLEADVQARIVSEVKQALSAD